MSASFSTPAHSPYTPNKPAAVKVSKRVFGAHWRVPVCIAYYESRYVLAATNGANRGPWQINIAAHPWVNASRLTRSWKYSAKVAWKISGHGTDWSAWSTRSLC